MKKYSNQRSLDNTKLPEKTNDLVEPYPQYPRPEDTHLAREEINDKSFTHRTSYDPDRFHETFGTLTQYVSGTPIKVTYYRLILSDDTERTAFGDVDFVDSDNHIDLEQILNFEFRTESQFNFNWDSENGEAAFTGEGIVYPGFEPHVGDKFVYRIHDAIGLFAITHVEPLSLRHGAYYRIAFNFRSRLNERDMNTLRARTKSTVVFDVQKALSENLSLLKYENYIILEELRRTRIELAQHYNNKFYDPLIESYIKPNGIYDPYLVEYMLKKVSMSVVRNRPRQCIITNDYEASLWSLFTYQRHNDLSSVMPAFEVVTKFDGIFGTQFNGLINKPFIRIVNSTNDNTVSSDGFGSRVSTGTMNGTITSASPTDTTEDDSSSNRGTRKIEFVNTAHGTVKTVITGGDGQVLQVNENKPRILPQGVYMGDYCPSRNVEETLPNGDTNVHHYYYYKNVNKGHITNTFKEPYCFKNRPPCTGDNLHLPDDLELNTSTTDGSIIPYVFSWNFYNGLTRDMTDLELLVYQYIETGYVDPRKVRDIVINFRKLPLEKLFYFGAVYLHLIDVAITTIT